MHLILFFLFNGRLIVELRMMDRWPRFFTDQMVLGSIYRKEMQSQAIVQSRQTTIPRRAKFARRSPAIIFSKITPTDYPGPLSTFLRSLLLRFQLLSWIVSNGTRKSGCNGFPFNGNISFLLCFRIEIRMPITFIAARTTERTIWNDFITE